MEIFDKSKVLAQLCKESKKYGMFISFSDEALHHEIVKDAPYLANDCDQILNDGEGWLLFDNEDEMHEYYDQTIGDDGPIGDLDGDCKPGIVYALTCNPHGQFETENT
jgi:hypothetical protein